MAESSHFTLWKKVTDYLHMKNIDFVPKIANPPNVPQLRPIEKFWAICKSKYSKLKDKPNTLRKFKGRWKKISQEVGENAEKNLMRKLRKNIVIAAEGGVESLPIN